MTSEEFTVWFNNELETKGVIFVHDLIQMHFSDEIPVWRAPNEKTEKHSQDPSK